MRAFRRIDLTSRSGTAKNTEEAADKLLTEVIKNFQEVLQAPPVAVRCPTNINEAPRRGYSPRKPKVKSRRRRRRNSTYSPHLATTRADPLAGSIKDHQGPKSDCDRIARARSSALESARPFLASPGCLPLLAAGSHSDHPLLVRQRLSRNEPACWWCRPIGLRGAYNANSFRRLRSCVLLLREAGKQPVLWRRAVGAELASFRNWNTESWMGFSEHVRGRRDR